MTTEIRDFGDNVAVVIYTDDTGVYQRLHNYALCYKVIPYMREQIRNKQVHYDMVAADMYFPKRKSEWLIKKMEAWHVSFDIDCKRKEKRESHPQPLKT